MGIIKDIPRKCKQKQDIIININIRPKKKKTEQKRVILYFKGDNKKKEEARTFTCQTSLKQNTKVKLFELC